MELTELQRAMSSIYGERDAGRGVDGTFRWLVEEMGEVARAIRTGDRENLEHEFSDALAWLSSLANLLEIDLAQAMERYRGGCPKCGATPCRCHP
jgi:NTP pyrophosphatase (non-canonical NTP hydrolase)